MNPFTPRKRAAAALAAAAVAVAPLAVSVAGTSASAAPATQAGNYVDSGYLQSALGLTSAAPVIETVTYDRFQWLLQQPGKFAFLVGDPADAGFKTRAQDVEAAAEQAGAKKVYWFDPNLSGDAVVGSTTEPNLDIRQPSGITSLATASQTVYGYAWDNLVSYFGNGLKVTITGGVGTESAKVSDVTTDPTVVNDQGGTGVNGTGALYDYTGGSDATATDDYFFVYDKDGGSASAPQKIVSWVDLSKESDSSATKTDVATAIGKAGASSLTQLDQFAFWKSEVNSKEAVQEQQRGLDPAKIGPVLGDADNASADGGWRIQQITYPELVHLLTTDTSKNAVILFGGTWCPNTRAVIKFVNQYAQRNNATVYNFDTVLDGGTVGGGTTSGTNPLQSRNNAWNGSTQFANPSNLYGDVVTTYLKNLATEYDPTIGSGSVTFYKGGNQAATPLSVRKLQVPYLVGYQNGASDNPYTSANGGGVTRQWIQQHTDVNGAPYYTEYMSEWYYTHPEAGQIGLTIPSDAAIWATVNGALKTFKWNTDPTKVAGYPNTGTDADDSSYLGGADTAKVTYTPANGSTAATVVAVSGGTVAISPSALTSALAAVSPKPANLAAARTALLAAESAATPNSSLISNLSTVFAAWTVAQTRKSSVQSALGDVQFGLEAVNKLGTFFGGLSGSRTATAALTGTVVKAPTTTTPGRYKVAVKVPAGQAKATGTVKVTLKSGKKTKTVSGKLVKGVVTLAVPKLPKGTWTVTISWPGDTHYAAARATGTIKVTQ